MLIFIYLTFVDFFPCAGAQAGTILGLFLNCGILEDNGNYLKVAFNKINPEKLAWVRTCLDIVKNTGMIDISADYSITVKSAGGEFVQQVAEISKSLPIWAKVGTMIPQPRRISADEGSAAGFIYQSIRVVASQSHASSSSQTTANIIELARTANVEIAGPEVQRFKEISYVAPKTMVLWSDPDLVDRTALGRLLAMFPETTSVCIVPQFRSKRMLTESAWSEISVPVSEINAGEDDFDSVEQNISEVLGIDLRATPALHVVVSAAGKLENAGTLLYKILCNSAKDQKVCIFMRYTTDGLASTDDFAATVTRAFLRSCGKQDALVPGQVWPDLQLQRHGAPYLALMFSNGAKGLEKTRQFQVPIERASIGKF